MEDETKPDLDKLLDKHPKVKIIISNRTLIDMNRDGLNFFEKLNLINEILPKITKHGFSIVDGIDCQIFIGKDLTPLKIFMENYKHGRSNSNIPLILGDNALT